jgi:hypothetical protein
MPDLIRHPPFGRLPRVDEHDLRVLDRTDRHRSSPVIATPSRGSARLPFTSIAPPTPTR